MNFQHQFLPQNDHKSAQNLIFSSHKLQQKQRNEMKFIAERERPKEMKLDYCYKLNNHK